MNGSQESSEAEHEQPPEAASREESVAGRLEKLQLLLNQRRKSERFWIVSALALIFGGIPLFAAAFDGLLPIPPWPFLIALFACFIVAIARREKATQLRRDCQTRISFWEQAKKRLEDEFEFGQDDGASYSDARHPYTQDLDVFGPASVFLRCNSCHSVLGRDALAALLRGEGGGGSSVLQRQEAICELTGLSQFREDLDAALHGVVRGLSAEEDWIHHYESETRALLDWGAEESPPSASAGIRSFRILCALISVAGITLWAGFGYGLMVAFVPYAFNGWLAGRQKGLKELMRSFERVGKTLGAWAEVFRVIEEYRGEAALPLDLRAQLCAGGERASVAVGRLQKAVGRLSWRRNTFWAFSGNTVLLFDLHARDAVLDWKRQHGAQLKAWFGGAGLFEALSSCAAWAAAHPSAVQPSWEGDGPAFEVSDLVHPLLPRSQRVANSLEMDHEGEVLLVTGSNMSGKSTFLRSVGLAVVFARAGLPVLARSARFHPMSVVTCMRVHDSLAMGSSHFHAEVRRLKACVDLAESEGTTLVLLDEILSGTNSKERHVGATAVIRSLSNLQTLSLVSTHDLGLCAIADDLGDRARVVHFRDLVRDGKMAFDYTLREGPVPSTNALRVMRAVGLDVPDR